MQNWKREMVNICAGFQDAYLAVMAGKEIVEFGGLSLYCILHIDCLFASYIQLVMLYPNC